MERFTARANNVLAGFWLLPAVIGCVFAAAAVLLLAVDHRQTFDFAFDGGAPAARSILELIAGSFITVIGLTLSLTVVTLQLVSGQFTPRALRGLLSDRVSQILAGTFVGIVAYCLIVLRSVRDPAPDGTGGFVPSLATSVGIVTALAALGLLLYFVHHIGRTIQASAIAARIYEQTVAAVDRLYPDGFGAAVAEAPAPLLAGWRADGEPVVARPPRAGYLQAVALDDLVRALAGHDCRVAISVRPGELVTGEDRAIELWGAPDGERARATAAAALVVADERDVRQDAAFGIRQLVDIGLRALSPGVNDPTTAVTCIGYVGAVLARMAARDFPSPVRRYVDERVTVVAEQISFDALLDLGIVELSRYATSDARVGCALLDVLSTTARAARRAAAGERLQAAVAAGRRIAGPMLEDARTDADGDEIRESLRRLEAVAVTYPSA